MAREKRMGSPSPGAGGIGVVEKAKDFKGSFGKLMKYMGKFMPLVVLAMVFAGLSSVFFILGPKKMGGATTILAEGLMNKVSGTGGIDLSAVAHILMIVILLYVIGAIFSMIQGVVMTIVTQKVAFNLRKDKQTSYGIF